MSRMVVFNLDRSSAGEIHTAVSRTWAINAGGQAAAMVSAADAANSWLQFGRLALVEHATLPAWCGMIDTPWGAIPPVKLTMYNAGYLLKVRSLEAPVTLTGSPGAIATQLLALANMVEDLGIQAGDIDMTGGTRSEVYDMRPVWDLLLELAGKTGMELNLRPERGVDGRLVLYLDFKTRLGIDTGFLLHDGPNANMQITDCQIDGEIWNRMTGIGDQSSKTSRLATPPTGDLDSINAYRLRSTVKQYSGVTSISVLQDNVNAALITPLTGTSRPHLILTAKVQESTFPVMRPGNSHVIRAANLYLPGGMCGWAGICRSTSMEYDESDNTLKLTLLGDL